VTFKNIFHFHKWKYTKLNANEDKKPHWRYFYVHRQCNCGQHQMHIGATFLGFKIFKSIPNVFENVSETEKIIIKNLLDNNELL
jgi:hypothetical protein